MPGHVDWLDGDASEFKAKCLALIDGQRKRYRSVEGMRPLLDTHIWLWWIGGIERVSVTLQPPCELFSFWPRIGVSLRHKNEPRCPDCAAKRRTLNAER